MQVPPAGEHRGPIALVGGKIVTVDSQFSVREAVLISGARIVAVGTSEEIRDRAPADARVVELQGRTVLPGFIDAHAHTVHRAISSLANPSLLGRHTVRDIVDAVGVAAADAPAGQWVVASPIGEAPDYFGLPEMLDEKRWPTRHELDAAAPDNPVYIPTPIAWPNPAILNTPALTALGIANGSNDPTIRCESDHAGRGLSGAVHGLNLYNASSPTAERLRGLLPQPTGAEVEAAVAGALRDNAAAGVTTIYEGHMNAFVPELRHLRERSALANRVVCTYEVQPTARVEEIAERFDRLDDARGSGTGDDWLKVLGVTVSLDGAIQFGKAHMIEPYLGPDGQLTNGTSVVSAEKLAQIAQLAFDADIRLNVLAAGSGAIGVAMDALRAVHERNDISDRRWVVQHFQHPTPDDISALAAMGMVAQTYSSVDFSKGATVYRDRLGGDLWRSVVPMRWWIDGGVTIAQGSDGAHYNPLFQIWATLRRQDGRSGASLLAPPKAVSREEAIATYTINGAVVVQCEDLIGSLEPGKLADCVILDHDILTCEVDRIRRTRVLATVIGGSVVHDPEGIIG